MVNYGEAIKRPFTDIATLVIGIVVGLIPIVQLLITGYAMTAAENTLNNNPAIPKWQPGKIVDYIVKTILAYVILLIYAIPAIIFALIGILMAGAALLPMFAGGYADMSTMGPAIITAILAGGIFFIIAFILWIIAMLFFPLGIVAYLKEKRFGAAFAVGKILKKILTGTYWISLIVASIWTLVLMFIAGILAFIPWIGFWISSGFFIFCSSVTNLTIMTQVYMETP